MYVLVNLSYELDVEKVSRKENTTLSFSGFLRHGIIAGTLFCVLHCLTAHLTFAGQCHFVFNSYAVNICLFTAYLEELCHPNSISSVNIVTETGTNTYSMHSHRSKIDTTPYRRSHTPWYTWTRVLRKMFFVRVLTNTRRWSAQVRKSHACTILYSHPRVYAYLDRRGVILFGSRGLWNGITNNSGIHAAVYYLNDVTYPWDAFVVCSLRTWMLPAVRQMSVNVIRLNSNYIE